MLTVFRKGLLVNNETASNDISVNSSLLISSLGIFFDMFSCIESIFQSVFVLCERVQQLHNIFSNIVVCGTDCVLLVENLVLCQTTYELQVIHELQLFLHFLVRFLDRPLLKFCFYHTTFECRIVKYSAWYWQDLHQAS